jgi:hypothetical protein
VFDIPDDKLDEVKSAIVEIFKVHLQNAGVSPTTNS